MKTTWEKNGISEPILAAQLVFPTVTKRNCRTGQSSCSKLAWKCLRENKRLHTQAWVLSISVQGTIDWHSPRKQLLHQKHQRNCRAVVPTYLNTPMALNLNTPKASPISLTKKNSRSWLRISNVLRSQANLIVNGNRLTVNTLSLNRGKDWTTKSPQRSSLKVNRSSPTTPKLMKRSARAADSTKPWQTTMARKFKAWPWNKFQAMSSLLKRVTTTRHALPSSAATCLRRALPTLPTAQARRPTRNATKPSQQKTRYC